MTDFSKYMRDDEVAEDLLRDGLFILKKPGSFTYGHDAVLLSDFARARSSDTVLDIGTGTGILAILVHAKTSACVTGVEIQHEMCDMAERSVEMNGLCESISIIEADIRSGDFPSPPRPFDVAVCNPPYFDDAARGQDVQRRTSVHEYACTLGDIIAFSSKMLKNGGKLFLSYPAAQLQKLCIALGIAAFSLKRISFVHSKPGREPYLVLCEAKKGGGNGVRFDPDIILEDESK